MPTTTPDLAAAERNLVETRTAFWALRGPTGLMTGGYALVKRRREAMFAAQWAYREAREQAGSA